MAAVFLHFLNRSIAASWLILAVLLLRLVLKKAPKWLFCILWTIVAIRLICPCSFESAVSLIPSAETLPEKVLTGNTFQVNTGISYVNSTVNEYLGDHYFEGVSVPVNYGNEVMTGFGIIWFAGLIILLGYGVFSYLRLRKKVSEAALLQENIWICDEVKSPFILGIVNPRIYLSSDIGQEQMQYVLAHERTHLKRKDPLWKLTGCLLTAVYWINPLMWVSYFLFCRDIELACDEKVIKEWTMTERKAYAEALLSCSIQRKMVMAYPIAFGEVSVKERVVMVMNYKKPAVWIVVIGIAACFLTAFCFLTNPKNAVPPSKTLADAPNVERPQLIMDGEVYVDPYMPVSRLPYGYTLSGILTEEQAFDTGLEGLEYYTNPHSEDDFFVYQECGVPIDINTVDTTRHQWAYKRWVKIENNGIENRKLTLDDVIWLSEKGAALEWSDFDLYSYYETGSGLYIRVYEIDEILSVWIGGIKYPESPVYFYLRVNNGSEDYVDIRTDDVEAFIQEHEVNHSASMEDAKNDRQF